MGGDTMGTSWQLRLVPFSSIDQQQVRAAIDEVFKRVIRQMSPWEVDSDLNRFNRASADTWVALSKDIERVLRQAIEIAELSLGRFDPCSGAAVNALGFGPRELAHSQSLPVRQTIARRRMRQSNWKELRVHPTLPQIYQNGCCEIDLCAIAKGYAVDLAAKALVELGARSFMIEIGGEAYGRGCKPDGQPWWCQFNPHQTVLALCGLAVASSGNALRKITEGHTRQGHIIDPQNIATRDSSLIEVSVVDPSCMRADALATALFVMGFEEGLRFANRLGICARFVRMGKQDESEEILSQGFKPYLD